jgi:hypothetical protein
MSSSQDPFRHRPSKPARELGDAPSIGRVSRFRNGGSERRASKVTAVDGLDKRITLTNGLAVLLLAGGLIVAGLAAWAFASAKRNQNAVSESGGAGPAAASPKEIASRSVPVPEPEILEAIVRKFLAARTPEALAPLIRQSDQETSVILAKLAGLEKQDGALKSVRYLNNLNSRCLQLEGVVVKFEGERNRLALLSPDEAGEWRVDFDGFDRYLSTGIDRILSGEPVDARVRVYVSTDSYYNGDFKDDQKWACYGIASPDSEQLMFGYVARDSVQHEALQSVIATKAEVRAGDTLRNSLQRMILDIRHHAGSDKRQFEILRVISDEWAIGPEPLDEIIRKPAGNR